MTNKANEGETCFRTLEAQASVSSPAVRAREHSTRANAGARRQSALETRLVALFNRGDTAELTSLKGIGPKRAESILRSREVDGPFARVRDCPLVVRTTANVQPSITCAQIADLTRIGLSKKVVVKICRDNIANGIEF